MHWLIDGVCTLQAPGRFRARVRFMLIPNEAPLLLSSEQRHSGDVWTTFPSCEQHEDDGLDEFPVM